MSTSTDPTAEELLEMIQGDPDDVLRERTDKLREMRDETNHDLLAEYIDLLIDQYESERESKARGGDRR